MEAGGGCAAIKESTATRVFKIKGGDAGSCGYSNVNASTSIAAYGSQYYAGGGGGGYGGGGGGSGGLELTGGGGGGGYLKTATIKLTSLDPIAITVGKGGRGGYDKDHLDGEDGEVSSFGSYVVAEGGGGGKCINPSDYILQTGGLGGTNGGNATKSCGGGGGGGYLIGCNVRGNGGDGYSFASGEVIGEFIHSIMNGVGLGGAGGTDRGPMVYGKPGPLGGGTYNKIAGPGSGVVVVTW